MDQNFKDLLLLSKLANPYGSGLKPEFRQAFQMILEGPHLGAVPLNMRTRSAGPAHQMAPEEHLQHLNVPRIGAGLKDGIEKDGTDG